MYEFFKKLLDERGLTTAEVCQATGIGQATISTWKKRNGILGAEYLLKLAKYFGVSMEYFLGGEQLEWSNDEKDFKLKDDYYLNEETRDLAQFYYDNPNHRVLFDASRNVKPEDLQKALKAIGIFIDDN